MYVVLAVTLPQIRSTITIEGGKHFISGNNDASGGSVLRVSSTGDLTLNEAIVTGGNNTASDGGRMYNDGTLTLINSTVSGNKITLLSSIVSGKIGSGGNEICLFNATVIADSFNLFGYSGETSAGAFSNFTPSSSDVTATSDGTNPTALAAILDTALAY